jgi:glycosyltransferase involved in cell wall biosynthesis
MTGIASPTLRAIASRSIPGARHPALPSAPLDDEAWNRLVSEVVAQRVWTVLAAAIADDHLPATDAQAERAFDEADAAVLASLHLDRALRAVWDRFVTAGIDGRVFKGTSSAVLFYPEPGMRTYSDVDLLVPSGQFDTACALLVEMGGRRHSPDPRTGFTAALGKSAGFTLDGGWEVDLHRSPQGGPFGAAVPTDELFRSSTSIAVGGRTVAALSRTNLFLTASYHAVLPADRRRLVPLLDVAFMMGAADLDIADLCATAARWQGSIVVAEAVIEASRLFELEPTPLLRWATGLRPSRREVRRLRVTRDRRPQAVVALGLSTAIAYPRWADRLRFVQAQVLHDERVPVRTRIRRLEQRLTSRGGTTATVVPGTVLHVVDSLAIGGAERMAVDVGNGLARRGWAVHLVATRALGPLVDDVSDQVRVHDLARRSRWDLDGLRSFRRLVARTDADLVHAHGWSSLAFATVGLAGRARPPKLVFHDHLPRSNRSARRSAVPRALRAAAWVSVRAHVAVDADLLDPPLRTRRRSIAAVVRNGVPLARFTEKTSSTIGPTARLVALANLRPQKDHETLFRATARLRDDGRSLELDVVGAGSDDEYRNRCEQLVHDLDLDAVVRFRGPVTNVADELPGFDLGVLSSRDESGPIALIEYLASGLPFVVTDVGEVPALLPERLRRWVVPPGDPSALATVIAELIDLDATERHEAAVEGRAFAEHELSIDRTIDEVVAIYERLRTTR